MEADLARYHHLDLRDHWRSDHTGRRRLTHRRLAVLIRHLPADAATVTEVSPGPIWDLTTVLLADIWQATAHSKTAHPLARQARARAHQIDTPERAQKIAAFRRRAAQRRDDIVTGRIT